jgi:hypothetical protein
LKEYIKFFGYWHTRKLNVNDTCIFSFGVRAQVEIKTEKALVTFGVRGSRTLPEVLL